LLLFAVVIDIQNFREFNEDLRYMNSIIIYIKDSTLT